jgi:hypothetical protein
VPRPGLHRRKDTTEAAAYLLVLPSQADRSEHQRGQETMKKIISLFQRNYDGDRLVRDEVVPGAEWVIAGEGIATRKWDGTCCMVRDGRLFKRYDAKKGKTPPVGFEPAQPEADPVSGHWPGWLAVGDGPDDKYHREAWQDFSGEDGTYELIGPKVQGGVEGCPHHILRLHGSDPIPDFPRTFDGIRFWLENYPQLEGVVWHHPDGRMAKIKAKDFGIKRRVKP